MASLSFRDRFFSPPVARAITSPSAIVALGAGAAVGILATVFTGGLAAPIIGGILGGAIGYGGRVALAIPRDGTAANVDPFGVDEPWRKAVMDSIRARNRFREAARTFQNGPLRDAVTETSDRIDQAVDEGWAVAQEGQLLSEARKRIDNREILWELQQAAAQIPAGGVATTAQARRIESLNAQMSSAQRMDQLIASTYDELQLLNAQLDQAVTQAIELSVSNRGSDLGSVSHNVEGIVDSLTSLRMAMGSLDGPAAPSAAPDVAPQVLDVSRDLPEPPTGQVQGSPGP